MEVDDAQLILMTLIFLAEDDEVEMKAAQENEAFQCCLLQSEAHFSACLSERCHNGHSHPLRSLRVVSMTETCSWTLCPSTWARAVWHAAWQAGVSGSVDTETNGHDHEIWASVSIATCQIFGHQLAHPRRANNHNHHDSVLGMICNLCSSVEHLYPAS